MNSQERKNAYKAFEKVAFKIMTPETREVAAKALRTWMPLAAIGAGVGLGARAIPEGMSRLMGMRSFRKIMQSAEYTPEEKERAVEAFSILNKYAPALAEHPTVAKSFIDSVLQQPPGTSMHEVVRRLIETEEKALRKTTDPLWSGIRAAPGVAGIKTE